MATRHPALTLALALATAATLAACSDPQPLTLPKVTRTPPANTPGPGSNTPGSNTPGSNTPASNTKPGDSHPPALSPDSRNLPLASPDATSGGTSGGDSAAVPVEALVGQVAGKPIYAHHVLDGLEAQLQTLGRREPLPVFRDRARELIQQKIQGLVQDALILDEANRDLDERQRMGIRGFIEFQRQELLRRYGQGSQALAQRNLIEQTGSGIQQTLDDIRDRVLIRSYLERNLDPLINVDRRDIERYYRDHHAAFNPPAQRNVNIIYTLNQREATWVQEQLKSGAPFTDLALDQRNAYPGKADLYTFEGDSAFGPVVDPALLDLEPGGWVGPLETRGRFYFLYLHELTQEPGRTLMDAQVDIERTLRDRQSFELRRDFGQRLRERASVSDEQRMTEAVLAIAQARYAAQP